MNAHGPDQTFHMVPFEEGEEKDIAVNNQWCKVEAICCIPKYKLNAVEKASDMQQRVDFFGAPVSKGQRK